MPRRATVAVVAMFVVGPVLPPAAAAPDVTTWDIQRPATAPQRTSRPEQFQSHVGPVYVPDVTDLASLLSWSPTYPDATPRRVTRPERHEHEVGPTYLPGVTIVSPPSAWTPTYPDTAPRLIERPERTEWTVGPVTLVPGTIVPDTWKSFYPDEVANDRTLAYLKPFSVAPVLVPDVTQPVTPLAWAPTFPDTVPHGKTHGARVALEHVAPVPVPGLTIPWDFRRIPVEETFAWQRPVISDLADPPAAPAKADRYVVITPATGDWTGHEGDIAWWDGIAAWKFDVPVEGWTCWNTAINQVNLFNGATWVALPPPFTLLTADPTSPIEDTWWVVRTGTSPTMVVSLKARIAGVTNTIATITI